MKRDMDYIREILLRVEESPVPLQVTDIHDQHRSWGELDYHLRLLSEAGFIHGKRQPPVGYSFFYDIELTWEGHEFLDAARDPSRWEQAKGVAGKAGIMTLNALKDILVQLGAEACKKILLGS